MDCKLYIYIHNIACLCKWKKFFQSSFSVAESFFFRFSSSNFDADFLNHLSSFVLIIIEGKFSVSFARKEINPSSIYTYFIPFFFSSNEEDLRNHLVCIKRI